MSYPNRREVCSGVLGASVFTPGMVLLPSSASAEAFAWKGSEALPGSLAKDSDFDGMLSQLNNQRSQLSLASDSFLKSECANVNNGALAAVQQSIAAGKIELKEANKAKIVSTIGAVVSGISLSLLFVATSPAWVVVAGAASGVLVLASTGTIALSLAAASKSGNVADGVAVGASWAGGRLSLIASAPKISTATQLTGRTFGGLAFAVDAVVATKAWIDVSTIKGNLDRLQQSADALKQETAKMVADLEYCRSVRIQQIDESISGLQYLKDLTSVSRPSNGGTIVLP